MNIIYHDPVIEFLKKFKKPTSAKIVKSIDLLEQYGLTLRMPHVRSLSSGLFELRVRGTQEIRILFCYHKNTVHFLHGFVKKSQKAPQQELELAKKRKQTLTKR